MILQIVAPLIASVGAAATLKQDMCVSPMAPSFSMTCCRCNLSPARNRISIAFGSDGELDLSPGLVGQRWVCRHHRDNVLCPLLPLILFNSARQFFRSDEGSYEAVCHVLCPDEYDCVGAGVASRHALGKSANLISIGVGLCCLRFWVGDELLVF